MAIDLMQHVNKAWRESRRYTGDGLPGAPINAPLPVGDPASDVHDPTKSEIRAAFVGVQTAFNTGLSTLDASVAAADADRIAAAASATSAAASAAGAALVTGALPRVARAALKALDTTSITVAYLTEAGREGMFVWRAGDYSPFVTADTQEGIYIKADAIAASSGAWVRERPARAMNVEWFGAVGGGAANNSTAIQCAVNVCQTEAGGTIFFGSYYRVVTGIVVTGNDVHFVGRDRSSGIYSDTAGKQLLRFGGDVTQSARCMVKDFILNMPVFTTATGDYVLWGQNIAQFYMENVRILGGYHCMALTGGLCADNTFVNCDFLYATGTAMVYAVDGTETVNGAHHFYRCRFNQPYGTSTPGRDSALYQGVRENSTAYEINEIVVVGNYYLQCLTAGTTAASPPTVNVWYGVNITDGTVVWRLMAHTSYTGITFDTNVYYCTVRECDFTSPFQFGIRTRNSLAGTPPQTIRVEQCTCHGPISMGIYAEAGRQLHFQSFEAWNPTDGTATTYGIFVSSACNDVKIVSAELYGFDNGVSIAGTGVRALVMGSSITACVNGISVAADTTAFRIIGNELGSTARWGANTVAVNIASGASDNYIVAHNVFLGASTGLSDGGSGSAKTVTPNH